ncbi:MAG: transglycosylase domain-containing protein [Solirubrobacteraceae bacterium]|jgi:penicillin-binding protein 1A
MAVAFTGFAAAAVIVGLAVAYVAAVANQIPSLGKLKPVQQQTSSVIYAANGEELGIVPGSSIRIPIPASQMPWILKVATISIEDQRFYTTGAIDLPSIIRAAVADLVTGKTVQGGSTIAMQLADNLYLGHQQTFERKIKEAVIAERLSQKMSKGEILADYLNNVPYGTVDGQEAYGVQAASEMFFDKPASKLTLEQAALLAGLPQAPSSYDPFQYPAAATQRRNEVLAKLAQLGYISAGRAAVAEHAPLELRRGSGYAALKDPYFFNWIVTLLDHRYGTKVVQDGGLRVYTTLEPKIEDLAEGAIRHVLVDPGDPASAEVVEAPQDGHILAMAQTGSYPQNQINYATQILRQPGSTFKAIVLADALSRGIDPFTTDYLSHTLPAGWLGAQYPTYTVSIDGGGNLDAPLNIEEALVASDNTVFAQLAADLGERTVTAMAYKLGVTTHLDSYPAEALGGLTYGVSPLEMANVYSTLADGGWRNKQIAITKVVFPSGRVDRSWGRPARVKVLSGAADAVEQQILEQNVLSGTATLSAIGCPSAAKTGTTTNLVDAWLDGFTPNYTSVVWMGYPQGDVPMDDVQGEPQYGGLLPAEIWHDTMETLATPPCAAFAKAPPMTYVPFQGHYQELGFASYTPPTKKHHHHQTAAGGGGTPTTTTTPTTPTTPPATPTPPTNTGGGAAPPTGAT